MNEWFVKGQNQYKILKKLVNICINCSGCLVEMISEIHFIEWNQLVSMLYEYNILKLVIV